MNRSIFVFLALFALGCSSTVSFRDLDDNPDAKPDAPLGIAPPEGDSEPDCCPKEENEGGGVEKKDAKATDPSGNDAGTSETKDGDCCDSTPKEEDSGGTETGTTVDSGGTETGTQDSGLDSGGTDAHSTHDAMSDVTHDVMSDTLNGYDAQDGKTLDVNDSATVDSPVGDPCPTESAYTCTGDQTYVCTSGAWVAYGGKCNFGCHVPSGDAGTDGGDSGVDPEENRCNCHGDWVQTSDGFQDTTNGQTWLALSTDWHGDGIYQDHCVGGDPAWHIPTKADLQKLFTQETPHNTEYCPSSGGANYQISRAWTVFNHPVRTSTTGSTSETHLYLDPLGDFIEVTDFISIDATFVCVKTS